MKKKLKKKKKKKKEETNADNMTPTGMVTLHDASTLACLKSYRRRMKCDPPFFTE